MRTNNAPLPAIDPLRRYDIETTMSLLGVSRFTIYKDIAEGRLTVIKEGRRTFVPASEIIRRSTLPVGSSAAA